MDMHSRILLSVTGRNRLLLQATAVLLLSVCPVLGQTTSELQNNTRWQAPSRTSVDWNKPPLEQVPGQLTPTQNQSIAIPANDQPQDVLTEGRQLEAGGKWAEALSLYQSAIKDFPQSQAIRVRSKLARLHYDAQRRYSDQSFLNTLRSTSATRSLNVYAEVLLKIQSYYVDTPDWQELIEFGWKSLEIATDSPDFRRANAADVSSSQMIAALKRTKDSMASQQVRSRHDAYIYASSAATMLDKLVGVPIQSSIYEFTNGAITALDPYSAFMSNSQYTETMSQIEGNFVGLGVELRTHPDHLEIVSVIPGGPAAVGNVAKADRIIAVDDIPVSKTGSEQAADKLRGVEGSFVSITVEREGMKTQAVRLQRKRVEIPSVDKVSIVDKQSGVGYIRLTNFQKTTSRDFDAALWKLHKSGMQSLIVDVRGNPGGLLSASVDVADKFLKHGVIVSTRGRNPLEDYTHTAERQSTWTIPLVVLVDENSASASEIFAAAIRDHQRGTIVGRQSYGKGSVQGIFPLNISGGGVRLTTAKFYSPTGKPINQVGVKPHVTVAERARPGPSGKTAKNSDNGLRIGIQVANRQVARSAKSAFRRQSVAGR